MTRKEKIEFLIGIREKTRSLDELLPVTRVTEFFRHTGPGYINTHTGEIFRSEEEFRNRLKHRTGIVRTVVFRNYSKRK